MNPDLCPLISLEKAGLHPAVYGAPVSAMVLVGVAVVAVLLVVLRNRKRSRDRRVLARVHSPSLKEVAFLKEEGEAGPHTPSSPGNCSLGDPMEFPRNRLYIYSSKILGTVSVGSQQLLLFTVAVWLPR